MNELINIAKAYLAIENYIIKCEYTYSVEDLLNEYKKYLEGSYISFTANDCIKNNKKSFELLQEKLERDSDTQYIRFLENMLIAVSDCYQNAYDLALEMMTKQNDSKYFMNIKTIQGTPMIFFVEKVSKLNTDGETINLEDMTKYEQRIINSRKLGDTYATE